MNDFIEKAVNFYIGYLEAGGKNAYLSKMLRLVIDGSIGKFEDRIFRDNSFLRTGTVQHIDRKRRQKPQAKRITHGHKPDDHEEYQGSRESASFPVLFAPFRTFRHVGHGVSQSPVPHKSRQKIRKTPDFRMKSGVFGAGGVTRTHDLLITKSGQSPKALISSAFGAFLLVIKWFQIVLSPLFSYARFPVWVAVWVRTVSAG